MAKKKSIYRLVRTPKGLRIGVGDFVEYWWWRDVRGHEERAKFKGVIHTLGGDWPVILRHASICNCIVAYKDIIRVIKKRVVDPKWMKYL